MNAISGRVKHILQEPRGLQPAGMLPMRRRLGPLLRRASSLLLSLPLRSPCSLLPKIALMFLKGKNKRGLRLKHADTPEDQAPRETCPALLSQLGRKVSNQQNRTQASSWPCTGTPMSHLHLVLGQSGKGLPLSLNCLVQAAS